MSQTLELTRDLLARPSVTPRDEGCQELMTQRLAAAGFAIESLRYGNVENLWARRGTGGPGVLLCRPHRCGPDRAARGLAHRPFVPAVRDGMLYGRGAADMKSGLAAMVTAAEEFVAAHPRHRGSIAFLITSDEEGPSVDGTRRVVEPSRRAASASTGASWASPRARASSATPSRSGGAAP